MKVIYKTNRVQISIDDDNSIIVNKCYIATKGKKLGQEVLGDNMYYYTMEQAVKRACLLVAGIECSTLENYVKIMRDTWQEMKDLIEL